MKMVTKVDSVVGMPQSKYFLLINDNRPTDRSFMYKTEKNTGALTLHVPAQPKLLLGGRVRTSARLGRKPLLDGVLCCHRRAVSTSATASKTCPVSGHKNGGSYYLSIPRTPPFTQW